MSRSSFPSVEAASPWTITGGAGTRLPRISRTWRGAVRGEEDVRLAVGRADRKDIPGIRGDDQGGDKVDVAGRVGDAIRIKVAFVRVTAMEDGAFHLYAEEASAMLGRDIVRGAIAPRLGDAESEFGGTRHETQLGPLAARLGEADGHAGTAHLVISQEWRQQKTRPTSGRASFLPSILILSICVG